MRRVTFAFALVVLAVPMLLAQRCPPPGPVERGKVELPGLGDRVRVSTDALGVPHVSATTLEDAVHVQGYLHARDRFFQMDVSRRSASGTLAELTGDPADLFSSDAITRPLGLRAAAERSEALLTARERQLSQAYVDGVNAWLEANPLPPEYGQLEITSVPPWQIGDTLTIGKAASLLFGLAWYENTDTEVLATYRTALGDIAGTALYFEDIARFEPMEHAATVPDAGGSVPFARLTPGGSSIARMPRPPGSIPALAERDADRLTREDSPLMDRLRDRSVAGSNVWGVAAWQSESGAPLVAGDSHLALTIPARVYEMHLSVENDPDSGSLNASGIGIAGIPSLILAAQTDHIAWGSTVFRGDISDFFADRLVRDAPGCPVALCIESAGEMHPVEERSETYLVNLPNDGVLDSSFDFTAFLPPEARNVLSVPFRSFGPIVEVTDRSVIDDPAPVVTETDVKTLQYTALHGTREAAILFGFIQARNVAEFREVARLSTALLQNWVVADTAGSLAYITTGEIPLRADLEAGNVVGELPVLVRDGSGPSNWIPDSGRSQGQVLPYRIVPFDEMPQVIDPPSGFVVNANNDPSGVELDNDLTNEFRPSSPGSIYYLGPQYRQGLRAGRITRLLREKLDAGQKISLEDMKRIQSNTQALDAEILVPFLLSAWQGGTAPGAPASFAALAADSEVAEAVGRLAAWDFSTPTGIAEGYDSSDVDGAREPVVSPTEAAHSVAATLYAAWRAELIDSTIIATLASVGLQQNASSFSFSGLVHLLRQDPFTGIGASGLDFFAQPAGEPAGVRRDVVLLAALRGALDLLASNRYAAAFGNSTDQNDYRWGLLHRVQLQHPLGRPSSIPPAAGFTDLVAGPGGLPGIARDGGFRTVNLGCCYLNPQAQGAHAFEFSVGSEYRVLFAVDDPAARPDGVLGFANLAGGSSGDSSSPLYASQLAKWLTVDHHRVPMNRRAVRVVAERVELFTPPLP